MAPTGPGQGVVIGPIVGVLEVTIGTWITNQQGLMVRHYENSAYTGEGSTLGAIATRLSTLLAPLVKPLLAVGATYRGIRVRRIDPLPPSPPAYELADQGPGTVAGDLMSPQTAGLITIGTAFAGRAYRGRAYIPFPSETDNDATGIPIPGYRTRADALALQLRTTVVVGTVDSVTLIPVLWHRKTRTTTDITSSSTRPGWATQRRRGFFGRQNPIPFS